MTSFDIRETASQIMYSVCGSPVVGGCVDTPGEVFCWVCGGATTKAMPQDEWNGASYTGQNKVARIESQWVCAACVHIHSRIAPVPGRPAAPGKRFGGNFRNYSHLYDDGASIQYQNASKGEKPIIIAFLRSKKRGRWFAAIADSGQKHVIPWAPINLSNGGTVLFDETLIDISGDDRWELVDDMIAMLTAGATKEEIEHCDYSQRAWTLCNDMIRAFESRWSGERASAWFGLAIWLSQRDEQQVQTRLAAERDALTQRKAAEKAAAKKGKADGRSRADRSVNETASGSSVRGRKRTTTNIDDGVRPVTQGELPRDVPECSVERPLGPSADTHAPCDQDGPRRPGMGDVVPGKTMPAGAQQFRLPGFD